MIKDPMNTTIHDLAKIVHGCEKMGVAFGIYMQPTKKQPIEMETKDENCSSQLEHEKAEGEK